MRTLKLVLFAGALLGASCGRSLRLPKDANWNANTATFAWWGGHVTVPVGFTYQVDQGADTFEGHFTSPDGKMLVRHDIGGYAGAWASRDGASFFEERVIEGVRVWFAKREVPDGRRGRATRVAVTFPDIGCANFFLESSRFEDVALIQEIARSFRPTGRSSPGVLCR
jgi:hypothetical protein